MNAYQLADKHGMLSRDEVDLIKHCVSLLPDEPVIVNIGANVGTSTCAMLEANQEAFIFSIDPKPYPQERENLIACGLPADRVSRVLSKSQNVAWPYEIDAVFVDGGHDDESVKGDITRWIPLTRHIALFHDYHHPNYAAKPGVHLDEIVDEAMKDWERIGEARYLVAFQKPFPIVAEFLTTSEIETRYAEVA